MTDWVSWFRYQLQASADGVVWAKNNRQMVSWSTEPVTLREILNSASFDNQLNLQINAGVTRVTLGESLGW